MPGQLYRKVDAAINEDQYIAGCKLQMTVSYIANKKGARLSTAEGREEVYKVISYLDRRDDKIAIYESQPKGRYKSNSNLKIEKVSPAQSKTRYARMQRYVQRTEVWKDKDAKGES